MSEKSYWDGYWRRQASRRRVLQGGGALIAGAAAISAVGCGDDDDSGSKPTTAAASGASATSAPAGASPAASAAASAAASPAIKDGDKVRIAMPSEPTTADPHDSSAGTDQLYLAPLYNSLYHYDEKGNAVPSLAQSFEVSPDGMRIVLKLRPNVKFHNGDAMTAEDVKYSLERMLSPDFKVSKAPLASVDSGEVVDPNTFAFKMKKPDYVFVGTGFGGVYIVPKAYAEKAGKDGFGKDPVGTGPYKMKSRTIGTGAIFERFEEHFAGKVASFKNADLALVPDATARVQMLQTGEKDLIIAIPPEQFERSKTLSGVKVIQQAGSNDTYFAFPLRDDVAGLAQGPVRTALKDKRVRQAFNYAVDRDSIAKKVFSGLATPFSVTVPTQPFHIGKKYDYDVKKAKDLLAAAGNKDLPVNMYMLAGSRLPGLAPLSAAVASNLRDAGFKVNEVAEEFNNWLNRLYADRPPFPDEGIIFSWAGSANGLNINLTEGKWLSKAITSWYANPQVDDLLGKNRTTANAQERNNLVKQACDILYEDAAGLWMVLIDDAIGFQTKTVANWKHQASYNVLRIQDVYAS